ncbi:MAG: PAS domain S-box protein, partial [Thermoleophilaceae bacterium]
MHRLPSEPADARAAAPTLRSLGLEGGAAPVQPRALAGAILESALDCAVVIDAAGRVLEWNRAAEETFGYTRVQALRQRLGNLIVPPELRDSHERWLMRQVASGESRLLGRRVELPAVRADGTRLTVELTITRTPDEQTAFVAYLRDITERQRREAALSAAAAGRKGLIELSQAALEGRPLEQLMQRAVDLAMEHLEPHFCQVWELLAPQQQLTMRSGFGFGPNNGDGDFAIPAHDNHQPGFTLAERRPVLVEDYGLETRFALTALLASQGVVSGVSVPIPGGEQGFGVIAVHWREPHKPPENQIAFLEALATVLGTAIHRRRSEELLEGAEREYRTLVERLPVVVYSAQPGAEGRWSYVSPQIEKLVGFTPEEWMA